MYKILEIESCFYCKYYKDITKYIEIKDNKHNKIISNEKIMIMGCKKQGIEFEWSKEFDMKILQKHCPLPSKEEVK